MHGLSSSTRLRPIALAASTLTLLVVGVAPPASAVVSVNGNQIISDSAEDHIRPTCTGGVLASAGTPTTGEPCRSLEAISVQANEGADNVDLSSLNATNFPALTSVSVLLGYDFDEDTATGSPFNDSFTGNEGRGELGQRWGRLRHLQRRGVSVGRCG